MCQVWGPFNQCPMFASSVALVCCPSVLHCNCYHNNFIYSDMLQVVMTELFQIYFFKTTKIHARKKLLITYHSSKPVS